MSSFHTTFLTRSYNVPHSQYDTHRCMNMLQDPELGEVMCNTEISISEQICSTCLMFGHRVTGLL